MFVKAPGGPSCATVSLGRTRAQLTCTLPRLPRLPTRISASRPQWPDSGIPTRLTSYKDHVRGRRHPHPRRLTRRSRTSSPTSTPTTVNACPTTMSSPIAIPANNSNFNCESAHSPNMAARSLPGNVNGLYVPVHRRDASTSSTSSSTTGSFFERGSLSSLARPTQGRMRSVSPMPRSPRAFGKRHLGTSRAHLC